ncbi:DUF4360 domain-containing protein [Spirillospora sp. NBC_00431]
MRKGMAVSAVAAALAMSAVSVNPAAASDEFLEHGPAGVTIEVATVNGSGCPPGTAAVALNSTNDAFTVTYSTYLAKAGGGTDPVLGRRNCQINMRVHVPQGFSYSVSKTDYRGYASLQPGANAAQLASYYFQGDSRTREYSYDIEGPYKKNWQNTDLIDDVTQLVWSPCGEQRNFNINTELRVEEGTDPTKISFIGMDSTDNSIKTTYHYTWKTCP